MSTTGRVDLSVPFEEKEEAKAAGARWDKASKKWFIPEDFTGDRSRFTKWEGPIIHSSAVLKDPKARQFFQITPSENQWKATAEKHEQAARRLATRSVMFRNLLAVVMEELQNRDIDLSAATTAEFEKQTVCTNCVNTKANCDCYEVDEPVFKKTKAAL